MNQHKPDRKDDDANARSLEDAATDPKNEPAGHPRRKGNEITGTHEPQPPSGLRADLDEADEESRGGDAGGVDKSM